MRLERSTMVGVVDSLEERGLIERRRGSDRRTNGLWLTRPGRLLAARLRRRIERHERGVAAGLSDAERAQLLNLLEKLAT
jgi:DNA-binding MarR family transcriptional regulator